ncbi:MAG: elongation factor G [Deltaproteobacteria bacterium]|nr:elongation factor G [Deltaproteobacteria bacterium]
MAVEPSRIRTIAIAGQGGVGKTSVADALVFATGGASRLGRVDDETSLFDFEPEETRRRCSITTSLHHFPWNKHEVTILDTPGQGNFVADTHYALRGSAGVVQVIDASAPLRAEASKVWNWAGELGQPVLFVLNKCERAEADIDARLEELREQFDARPVLLTIPMTGGEIMDGVIDVAAGCAFAYEGASGKSATVEVPASAAERVATLRSAVVEAAAEGDDELLEKYLEAGDLSPEEVRKGLRESVLARSVQPVVCVSATANVGIVQLLDAIVDLMPAPAELAGVAAKNDDGASVVLAPDASAPFAGFVFKTIVDPHIGHLSVMRVVSGTVTADTNVVNPITRTKERFGHLLKLEGRKTKEVDSATIGEIIAVAKLRDTHAGQTLADAAHPVEVESFSPVTPTISFAVEARKRGEEDKATQGLHKLCEEDLALHVDRDEETGEILVSGSGQLHVEVACERLERKYGIGVVLKAPKVPYRETVRAKVGAHGRLKKQSGGHGQFADCKIEIEPMPRGGGFQFVDKIVGGSIPRNYIPAVEKGVQDALKAGTIAGYPVVDVKVTVIDGQYHDVDSSEMAFKVAGSMAFKDGFAQAKPTLLEPFVVMEVSVPDECMGDVMGDLNSRRAKVEGMEQRGHAQVIRAKVPMAEVLRYAPDLTSMTSGRGSFEIAFSHYEPVPEHLVPKIVSESKKSAAQP